MSMQSTTRIAQNDTRLRSEYGPFVSPIEHNKSSSTSSTSSPTNKSIQIQQIMAIKSGINNIDDNDEENLAKKARRSIRLNHHNIVNKYTLVRPSSSVPSNKWILSSRIDEGGQGGIYKCHKLAADIDDGRYVAKVITLHGTKTQRFIDMDYYVKAYHFVNNNGLLNYMDIYYNWDDITIIMQELDHSLSDIGRIEQCIHWKHELKYLRQGNAFRANRTCIRYIGSQIARNLKRIHDAGRSHNDLKPSNVMFDAQNDKWRIIDYDLSMDMQEKGSINVPGPNGTETWNAPEMRQKRSRISKFGDIFSFGLIMLYLWNGGGAMAQWKVYLYQQNKLRKDWKDVLDWLYTPDGNKCFIDSLEKYVHDRDVLELLQRTLRHKAWLRPSIDSILGMRLFAGSENDSNDMNGINLSEAGLDIDHPGLFVLSDKSQYKAVALEYCQKMRWKGPIEAVQCVGAVYEAIVTIGAGGDEHCASALGLTQRIAISEAYKKLVSSVIPKISDNNGDIEEEEEEPSVYVGEDVENKEIDKGEEGGFNKFVNVIKNWMYQWGDK